MKTSKRLFRWSVLCITIFVSLLMLGYVFYELIDFDSWPYQGTIIIACFLGGVALPMIVVTLFPGEDE
ncbi:hypothetical protein Pan241w_40420 [Gimesia alba]|uniref:Uncharacterized protein n=1 Tax=Gimesia alba TaxID=2527973 RepID=A0A517RJ90_9PLAN|nr:hypothetical protein [Gimesia alba]QDT43938.1 hypothetical protein Pan241w_40420 [Gimesia alba]